MQKYLLILLVAASCLSVNGAKAQAREYQNFPIFITLQFHSLSMPFGNLKSNLKNIGIGIGTEFSYNGNHNWVQHLDLVWYTNKKVGNGLLFSTQMGYRPKLLDHAFGEIKVGIGYSMSLRPSNAWVQQNGEWKSMGKKGKGMLAVPIGISLGYYDYSDKTALSPFLGYQSIFLLDYNKSLPIVPESLIQVGSAVYY